MDTAAGSAALGSELVQQGEAIGQAEGDLTSAGHATLLGAVFTLAQTGSSCSGYIEAAVWKSTRTVRKGPVLLLDGGMH